MRPLNCILVLIFVSLQYSLIYSQCEGARIGGNERVMLLSAGDDQLNFDISGLSLNINYDNTGDLITVSGPSGMTFLTDGIGFAQNVVANSSISTLGPYVPGPVKLFDPKIGTNGYGTFGGGTSGYVAFSYSGKFGWIELDQCGRTACSDYRFTITNTFYDNATTSSDIKTGFCPAKVIENIPTLSQWGLWILSLLLIIIGVVAVDDKVKIVRR